MRKMTEVELINKVLSWVGDKVRFKQGFGLQHDAPDAVKFVAMGHGWLHFDLQMWDGSTLYMEAWVDREETELTITNRNPVTDETELTFLNVILLS